MKNGLNIVVRITFVNGVCAAPKMVIIQMGVRKVKRKINGAKNVKLIPIMNYCVYQIRKKGRIAGTKTLRRRKVKLLPNLIKLVGKTIPHNHIVCKRHLKVPGQTS